MSTSTDALYSDLRIADSGTEYVVQRVGAMFVLTAGELLPAMVPVTLPMPSPDPDIVPIYVSQWAVEANARQNDCGPACVAMHLRTRGDHTPVNQLRTADETGLTNAIQLRDMLKAHGVDSMIEQTPATLSLAQAVKPYSLLLVNYAPLAPYAQDKAFKGWHWLIYIGPDPVNGFNSLVLDPDYWNERISEGDHKSYPTKVLRSAWRPYSNTEQATAIYVSSGPLPPPPPFEPHYVSATANLNVRSGPGLTYAPPIGLLKIGTTVKVIREQDGWLRLDGAAERWVNAAYTKLVPDPASTPVDIPAPTPSPVVVLPTPQPTTRKAAIHFQTGGDKNGLLDLLHTGKLGGVLNMRVARDNDLTATEVKATAPTVEVCERFWFDDKVSPSGRAFVPDWTQRNLRQVGYDWSREYFTTFKVDRNSNWHQIINEPSWGLGTASFWMGAMDYAETINVNLGLLCISNGNPPLPDEMSRADYREFWVDPEILMMLRRGKKRGDAMLLHQYALPQEQGKAWADTWCALRHQRVYAVLPDDLKDMPLIIGEFGDTHGLAYGTQHYIDNLKQALSLVQNDTYLRWLALWTWGCVNEVQWGKDKIDSAQAEIAAAL